MGMYVLNYLLAVHQRVEMFTYRYYKPIHFAVFHCVKHSVGQTQNYY